jgi:osmoprotectant transport system permease protein
MFLFAHPSSDFAGAAYMNFFEFIKNNWREVLAFTGEHLYLVLISLTVAVLVGIPAGVLVVRRESLKRFVLGLAGVLQTVPSLALFGFLIPLPFLGGIGARTAIVALVLYALLPLIRNTVTGIEGVDRSVREAATAMGMTERQILWQVELPLALSVILAGVRVAAVISIGVATIAAAIGAGGLGTYIFRGLRQNDNTLVLAGAVPAALMALAADWLLGLLEARFNAQAKLYVGTPDERRARQRRRRLVFAALALLVVAGMFAVWRSGGRQGEAVVDVNEPARAPVRVGSKDFTESIILAEMLAQELEARGATVVRRFELGGNLCHDALTNAQIDVYPEYTGTSYTAILKHQPVSDPRAVYEAVRREYAEKFNVEASAPLGFSNDFAILVRGAGRTRSQSAHHLRYGRARAQLARRFRSGFHVARRRLSRLRPRLQFAVCRPPARDGFIAHLSRPRRPRSGHHRGQLDRRPDRRPRPLPTRRRPPLFSALRSRLSHAPRRALTKRAPQ